MSALTSIFIAFLLMFAALIGWVIRLSSELDASQQETEAWMAKARTFLDRAHKAEEELEALKPEIDGWFFSPQKGPSSVPAIEAQVRQLAAELEESETPKGKHFCGTMGWTVLPWNMEACEFCRPGNAMGPQKSPSSVPAIQAQVRQVEKEITDV